MFEKWTQYLLGMSRIILLSLLLIFLTSCMAMLSDVTKGERVSFEINLSERVNESKPIDRNIQISRTDDASKPYRIIGAISFELPENTERKKVDAFLSELMKKIDADGIVNVKRIGWYMRPRAEDIPVDAEIVRQNYTPIVEKWSGEIFVWK